MLWRKMLRDMRLQKAQFLSIILMIFIGLFVYAGMSAVGEGMQQSSKDYYKETNLSDAVIYRGGITPQDVELMKKQRGINAVERRAQIDVQIANDQDTLLSLNAIENGTISGMYLITGEPYDSKKAGVWLDSMFAKAHQLKWKDTLEITTPAGEMQLTIRGLVMQPEYIYAIKDESQILPDHTGYGYAFISGKMYPQIMDEMYSQLLIKGDAKKSTLETYAKQYLSGEQATVLMQKDFPGQAMFANEVEQQKAMQFIFPIAFLLIALLTMITAMTRMTANQRTQIGTLKAVGISSWKIYAHYLSYAVVPALVGAVAGTVSGSILLPKLMFGFQAEFYAIPEWNRYVSWNVYFAVLLSVLICTVSGFLACKKELSPSAAAILRSRMPKPVKAATPKRTKGKYSFKVQWNIRDIGRNRMRSLITVMGVAGCMMLILSALGLNNTIDGLLSWMYEDIYTFETKVILNDAHPNTYDIEGVQYIQEGPIKVKVNSDQQIENLTVSETGSFIQYMDEDRNAVELPSTGVAVTYKTAKLLDLQKGDTIHWKSYEGKKWIISKIEQIIRTPLAQGIYMTKHEYEASAQTMKPTAQTMKPTAYLTDKIATQLNSSNEQTVQSKDNIVADMNSMLETMDVIIKILIIAAIFLGVVVLYNLGILSFTEKVRDLATLQVLGFKEKQLKGLLAIQNTWLTMGGILVGIPMGYLLLAYLMQFMGDTMDMVPVIRLHTYVGSAAGIFLLSVIINYIMNHKLKKIKMVEALKSVE